MAKIAGAEKLTASRLIEEIRLGARFTAYANTASLIALADRSPNHIQYVPPRTSRLSLGLRYALLPLAIGWSGILVEPLHTLGTLYQNLRGGADITAAILQNVEHIFHRGFASPEELRTLRDLAMDIGSRKV